jgi:beta-1,4-mannosyl-glycoprotein beta-1,4-N-acetylglucosaminyltransferase
MVFDCFAFFNELDLLEIRLNELDSVVDRFVLVEATRTFQKKPKPLHFEENKQRFARFLPKISHVVVNEYPNFFTKFRIPKFWDYDNHQKEQVMRVIKDCAPDDIIIFSDLDEIPSPAKIIAHKLTPGIKVFEQKLFYYYLNSLAISATGQPDLWKGSIMLYRKDITTLKKIRSLRGQTGKNITIVREGGWHFSYLGGIEKIVTKIESLAHEEFNDAYFKNPERLKNAIASGKDIFDRDIHYKLVEVDASFPSYIRDNIQKFSHLMRHASSA